MKHSCSLWSYDSLSRLFASGVYIARGDEPAGAAAVCHRLKEKMLAAGFSRSASATRGELTNGRRCFRTSRERIIVRAAAGLKVPEKFSKVRYIKESALPRVAPAAYHCSIAEMGSRMVPLCFDCQAQSSRLMFRSGNWQNPLLVARRVISVQHHWPISAWSEAERKHSESFQNITCVFAATRRCTSRYLIASITKSCQMPPCTIQLQRRPLALFPHLSLSLAWCSYSSFPFCWFRLCMVVSVSLQPQERWSYQLKSAQPQTQPPVQWKSLLLLVAWHSSALPRSGIPKGRLPVCEGCAWRR